jgi:hypothetical protein
MKQLAFFQETLRNKPRCTNDYTNGVFIRSKNLAQKYNYIQPNRDNSIAWLIVDIDHDNTYIDDLNPKPNMITYNRDNPRCHAFYALETPIHKNPNSSTHAQRYFTAVQFALTEKLRGDQHYNGDICKNPLSGHWRVLLVHDEFWSLEHLAEYVDLAKEDIQIKYEEAKKSGTGYGRNCTIFDECREWAYKAIREDFNLRQGDWAFKVKKRCQELNNCFKTPLFVGEVDQIAKSIAKYVWNIRHGLTNFSKQAEKGRKGGKVSGEIRLAKNQEKRTKALEMLLNGHRQVEIAEHLGVTQKTISKWKNSKNKMLKLNDND